MTDLLPCHHCGNIPKISWKGGMVCEVECKTCDFDIGPFWSEADAIAAWNTRQPATQGVWSKKVSLASSAYPPATQADPLQSRVLTADMAFPSGQSDDVLVEEVGHLLNEWQTGYDGHNPANLPTDDERYFVRASILPILQREIAAAHAAGRAERQAEVVAWLRQQVWREWPSASSAVHSFVKVIERGQDGSKGDE